MTKWRLDSDTVVTVVNCQQYGDGAAIGSVVTDRIGVLLCTLKNILIVASMFNIKEGVLNYFSKQSMKGQRELKPDRWPGAE